MSDTYFDVEGGPSGILPGALTACIACTLLQFGVNEAEVARVKYFSSRPEGASTSQMSAHGPSSKTRQEASPSIGSQLLLLFGLKRITDEEYLATLKKERDGHLRRIEELEAQLKSDNSALSENDGSA